MHNTKTTASHPGKFKRVRGDTDGYRFWRPTENPVFFGEFLSEAMLPTRFGDAKVAIFRELNGGTETAVYINSTVLAQKWEDVAPQVGEMVRIEFLGKKSSPNGYLYNRFNLAVVELETPEGSDE